MFWAFKLSFVVDILAFFGLKTVWATFEKLGNFFSNLKVTLLTTMIFQAEHCYAWWNLC